jgi:hypothetical protein
MYDDPKAQTAGSYVDRADETPTVRRFLDLSQENVYRLESYIVELEDRVNGPQPKSAINAAGTSGAVPAPYSGLHNHAGHINRQLANLGDRLNNILCRL